MTEATSMSQLTKSNIGNTLLLLTLEVRRNGILRLHSYIYTPSHCHWHARPRLDIRSCITSWPQIYRRQNQIQSLAFRDCFSTMSAFKLYHHHHHLISRALKHGPLAFKHVTLAWNHSHGLFRRPLQHSQPQNQHQNCAGHILYRFKYVFSNRLRLSHHFSPFAILIGKDVVSV